MQVRAHVRAVVVKSPEGIPGLRLEEVPAPGSVASLGPSELRIRVAASGLNRADLLQSMGKYPAPPGSPPDQLGLEYAGEVVARGAAVRAFNLGDRVMGIVGGGGMAEEVWVHEREALPVPHAWTWAQAAAVPEAFLTAYDALILQGELRPFESVLIHGATGGVGSAASQIAAAFGARVLGTGRSRAKLETCAQAYGLNEPIAVDETGQFVAQVRRLTDGRGADLVLELLGGNNLPESIRAAAPRARILLVGLLVGGRAELDLSALLQKRIRLQGTVLRSRPAEEKMVLAQAARRDLIPLFNTGRLRPVVAVQLPAERFVEAFQWMDRLPVPGKVVLTWP